jgi:hypothetical protein
MPGMVCSLFFFSHLLIRCLVESCRLLVHMGCRREARNFPIFLSRMTSCTKICTAMINHPSFHPAVDSSLLRTSRPLSLRRAKASCRTSTVVRYSTARRMACCSTHAVNRVLQDKFFRFSCYYPIDHKDGLIKQGMGGWVF